MFLQLPVAQEKKTDWFILDTYVSTSVGLRKIIYFVQSFIMYTIGKCLDAVRPQVIVVSIFV